MTEHSRIESECAEYLQHLGFLVIHTHDAKNRPAEVGIADMLAIRKRRNMLGSIESVSPAVMAIEVKAGADKLRKEQEAWLAKAREQCVMILVVHSLDELMEAVPR